MRIARDHVRVRVPATSANLGPGFDSFGLALGIYDQLTVRATAGETEVVVRGEGAGEVPGGEDHLVVRAIRAGLEHAGASQVGLSLSCTNRIPHGRGLGSSASAAVAGLVAARGLISEPEALDNDTILNLATAFEGHPDNAAPAIFGAVTIAWMEHGRARAQRMEMDERIVLSVLVPTERLATDRARAVLPREIAHADAAFNAGRAGLLTLALGGHPELLLPATEDRLHQAQRADSMMATYAAVMRLREEGVAAAISGAGPTVLVFGEVPTQLRAEFAGHWKMYTPSLDTSGARIVDEDN